MEPTARECVAYDLGAVPGMPKYEYGGLAIDAADPDALFIGGNANEAGGAIYAVKVVRNARKHIAGFTGTTSQRASARYVDVGPIPPGASSPSPEIPGTRFSAP